MVIFMARRYHILPSIVNLQASKSTKIAPICSRYGTCLEQIRKEATVEDGWCILLVPAFLPIFTSLPL